MQTLPRFFSWLKNVKCFAKNSNKVMIRSLQQLCDRAHSLASGTNVHWAHAVKNTIRIKPVVQFSFLCQQEAGATTSLLSKTNITISVASPVSANCCICHVKKQDMTGYWYVNHRINAHSHSFAFRKYATWWWSLRDVVKSTKCVQQLVFNTNHKQMRSKSVCMWAPQSVLETSCGEIFSF